MACALVPWKAKELTPIVLLPIAGVVCLGSFIALLPDLVLNVASMCGFNCKQLRQRQMCRSTCAMAYLSSRQYDKAKTSNCSAFAVTSTMTACVHLTYILEQMQEVKTADSISVCS